MYNQTEQNEAEQDEMYFKYQCLECKVINKIKSKSPIRCKECGYRILQKMRTKEYIQYDAL